MQSQTPNLPTAAPLFNVTPPPPVSKTRKRRKPGPRPVKHKGKRKSIDKKVIAEMLQQGYKQKHIAETTGASVPTVCSINTILKQNVAAINTFIISKGLILNYKQKQAIELALQLNTSLEKQLQDNTLTASDKINWLKTLNAAFTTFFEKERLLSNKSTSNIAVLSKFMQAALNEV